MVIAAWVQGPVAEPCDKARQLFHGFFVGLASFLQAGQFGITEHVLISRRKIHLLLGKAIHDLSYSGAFSFALRPIRERSQDANANDSPVLLLADRKSFL